MNKTALSTAIAVAVLVIGLQFFQNAMLKTRVESLEHTIIDYRDRESLAGGGGLSALPPSETNPADANAATASGPTAETDILSLEDSARVRAELKEILAVRDPMERIQALLAFVSKLSDAAIPDALTQLRENTPEWDPDARVAAQLMLTRWGKVDPAGALAYVGELDYRKAGGDAATIIASLAAQDPQQAIEWLGDPDNKLVNQPWLGQILAGSITKEWVRHDPEAALEWAMTLPKNQQTGAFGGVLGTIAATDPQRASKLAAELPEGDSRRDVIGQIARSWGETDPGEAMGWASRLEGDERNRAMGEALGSWAQSDPDAAAGFVDQLAEEERSEGMLDRVASNWARRDPAEAATWLGSKAESADKADAMGDVMWNWTTTDPAAASTWLLEQPEGDSRDEGIVALARVTFDDDPASAVTWAASMSDEGDRRRSVSIGVNVWLDRDPDAANAWLSTTDSISEDEVNRILTERADRKAREAGEG